MCSQCGAGLTLPPVAERELGSLYPDGYEAFELPARGAARLASTAIRGWQRFLALRREPLRALRNRSPGRLIEVGCGRGDIAAALVDRGWRVTGIEPSRTACEVAARRGVDARCGTLGTVDLKPGSYDAALFRHSLEHVVDPVAELARVRAALRPGGLVLITVPNFGGRQARRFRSHWYHLDLPRHRVHLTPGALHAALGRAGLEPLLLRTSTSTVGLPASAQYAVAGRCLFPSGNPLRIAVAAASVVYPLAWLLDRGGRGDLLHAVARRPAA
jgi:SAM-dependent methyltransferase